LGRAPCAAARRLARWTGAPGRPAPLMSPDGLRPSPPLLRSAGHPGAPVRGLARVAAVIHLSD